MIWTDRSECYRDKTIKTTRALTQYNIIGLLPALCPVPAIINKLPLCVYIVLCRYTCANYNIFCTEKMWDDFLTFKLFQLKLDIIFIFIPPSFGPRPPPPLFLFLFSFALLFLSYSFPRPSLIYYIPSPRLPDRFACCHSGIMETGK